jgi:hypothetical protein
MPRVSEAVFALGRAAELALATEDIRLGASIVRSFRWSKKSRPLRRHRIRGRLSRFPVAPLGLVAEHLSGLRGADGDAGACARRQGGRTQRQPAASAFIASPARRVAAQGVAGTGNQFW